MANPIIEFNDSEVGIVLGTVFHTVGAIALLGGLVGYLAWHRQLMANGHHHRKVLDASAFLTYIAIVVNLLGGFMRTFESDHPHLTAFAESAWVRAIAIKHVFIFAGMAAAVYLLEVVSPRLLKAFRDGTLAEAKQTGHRIGVLVVALGILVAAVLGAITQVVPPVEASGDVDAMDHDDMLMGARYANVTGQLTTTPLAPATWTGGFDVASGTAVIEGTFQWSPATYALAVDLKRPDGTLATTMASDNGRAETSLEAPQPGPWTYTVRADLAVNAQWTLSLRMADAAADESVLADRVTIPPGRFVEINTDAPLNGSMHWAWSSDAPLAFNIHTHFDDDVQYVVEEQGAGSTGSYTVVRKGIHSYLWENTGALPVALDYRAWGRWDLDSTSP